MGSKDGGRVGVPRDVESRLSARRGARRGARRVLLPRSPRPPRVLAVGISVHHHFCNLSVFSSHARPSHDRRGSSEDGVPRVPPRPFRARAAALLRSLSRSRGASRRVSFALDARRARTKERLARERGNARVAGRSSRATRGDLRRDVEGWAARGKTRRKTRERGRVNANARARNVAIAR